MERQRVAMLNKKCMAPLGKVHTVRDKSQAGLTLIEILISLVITLVVFLGLMQSALLSMSVNTGTSLRNIAVAVADMRMREARNLPWTDTTDLLVDDPNLISVVNCPAGFASNGVLIPRDLRNITGFDFCTNMAVTALGADNKQVVITVGWIWQNEDYTHTVSTVVGRQ